MRRYYKYWIFLILYYICWGLIIFSLWKKLSVSETRNRMAFMNRMTNQISITSNAGVTPLLRDFSDKDIPEKIEVFYEKDGNMKIIGGADNTYLFPLEGKEGEVIGFVVYGYKSTVTKQMLFLAEISAFVFFIPVFIAAFIINKKILRPFQEFSDYPEKLSKGLVSDGLPETKSRLFGRYVWGMNMLGNKIDEDKREIDRLLFDRKQFISTLAHGIKTPVSNIKLYSEAIETGLYRDGNPDPKDSEIAAKIKKNADDIAELAGKILDDPGSLQSKYSPEIENFYLDEIRSRVVEDFQNRCNVNNIPFAIELSGNPLVNSDINLVIKCLTQFIENAIKYGDGTGIKLKCFRQDDMMFYSVINNGVTIDSREIPYVFNCYYRGSNSYNHEGSGIGLYEAKSIAKALGGDIIMKIWENTTEVLMYIPDN
ncbi:sensor histidine kinase [Pseudobutyrivibrio sp.]|uniref:sensor histidine kinase n=1 Tax=Pseudobutyrivibrio sp. TaxID=2014367 RepID=UPI0025F5EC99|nr:HAMP domain-containing sensor histidine kinase [Pseudobutyrivibrio sp.]MBR5648727.1 HAMP domain-containing histidine kinase [Pseudobutyrivibrio sp.]